jgi:hypothetical protein
VDSGIRSRSVSRSASIRQLAARNSLGLSAIVVVLAVAWFAIARYSILMAAADRNQVALTAAEKVFSNHRQRMQTMLKNECQILAEDPRLKATLSTPDIDEPTIVDILKDLSKLAGKDLLAVLTPNARVKAVLGAEQFRGLDFSTSALLKSAQGAENAVSSSWVVGDKLYDVAASALRAGDRTIAYLVLGEPVDKRVLESIVEQTGAGVSLIVDNRAVIGVPDLPEYKAAFEEVAPDPSTYATKSVDAGGENFVARTLSVEGPMVPTRIAFVRPARSVGQHERSLGFLVWVPLIGAVVLACYSVWRFLNR